MERCQLCDEPAPPLVACGSGNNCTARVCGACLTTDGICVACDRERCRTALDDRVRRLVWMRLPVIAEEIRQSAVSPRVARLACDLVDAYEEETR